MINQFAVTMRKESEYAVIYTDGYINNLGGEKIAEVANTLIGDGIYKLVLNLEKSTVVNSIGISILIEIIEKLQETNGKLVFCGLTKTIAKTFTIMGLTQFAAISDTEELAIQGL
ncbi:MAG TPA: anti-anti-sigma factor [Cyanobacteria bacterium UBA8530]|nr:anti-anti-sigma factor [Cyanobacteria bacterium UBA8530]